MPKRKKDSRETVGCCTQPEDDYSLRHAYGNICIFSLFMKKKRMMILLPDLGNSSINIGAFKIKYRRNI